MSSTSPKGLRRFVCMAVAGEGLGARGERASDGRRRANLAPKTETHINMLAFNDQHRRALVVQQQHEPGQLPRRQLAIHRARRRKGIAARRRPAGRDWDGLGQFPRRCPTKERARKRMRRTRGRRDGRGATCARWPEPSWRRDRQRGAARVLAALPGKAQPHPSPSLSLSLSFSSHAQQTTHPFSPPSSPQHSPPCGFAARKVTGPTVTNHDPSPVSLPYQPWLTR